MTCPSPPSRPRRRALLLAVGGIAAAAVLSALLLAGLDRAGLAPALSHASAQQHYRWR